MSHQIKYLGPTQHTRQISRADAKTAGFVLAEDLEWSLANRHSLILDDLDETALEYFAGDPDFRVKEVASEDEAEVRLTKKEAADAEVAASSAGGASGGGAAAGTTRGGRTTTSTTTATT
jgi:hypothetical protein